MTPRITPRQCDLVLTGTQKFAAIAPIVLFLTFPIIAFVVFRNADAVGQDSLPPYFPWFPLGIFAVLALVFAWTIAGTPHRLTVTHDQQLEFRSFLTTRRVRAANVLSIRPRNLYVQANLSGYELEHRDGKIRFPGQFTGLHAVLYELKIANPAVHISGC